MKKDKIAIVGSGDIGKTIQHYLPKDVNVVVVDSKDGNGADLAKAIELHKGGDVILVNTPIPDDSFEINGIRYSPVKQEPKKSPISKSGMLRHLVEYMPYILNDYGGGNARARTLSDNIDIVIEFGLIELKKSKLSKWERDEVVRLFNLKYTKI